LKVNFSEYSLLIETILQHVPKSRPNLLKSPPRERTSDKTHSLNERTPDGNEGERLGGKDKKRARRAFDHDQRRRKGKLTNRYGSSKHRGGKNERNGKKR